MAAMRYSTLGGGKRLRPLLVYATGEAVTAPEAALDRIAAALEMIHVYSLIHDDLPAMDDDDMRRGKPTCHKAYGEALAVLAGDALQALAFATLTDEAISPDPGLRLALVNSMAEAAGLRGMAGGQAMDLASEGKALSVEDLERMHRLKTGALIQCRRGDSGAPVCLRRLHRPGLPDPRRSVGRRRRSRAAGQGLRGRPTVEQGHLPEPAGDRGLAQTGPATGGRGTGESATPWTGGRFASFPCPLHCGKNALSWDYRWGMTVIAANAAPGTAARRDCPHPPSCVPHPFLRSDWTQGTG